MSAPTSSRTTSPKRRRRSSYSTARSRSSASSDTVKSASRLTRNIECETTSMPGNSLSRLRAITDSREMNVSLPIGTKRGSTSFGTFTRAKVSWPDAGSRTHTARLSERFEMYGKGRPGPTASGVSAGKIWSWKALSAARSSSLLHSSHVTIRMPSSSRAGRSTSSHWRVWRLPCSVTSSAMRSIASIGLSPSGPRESMRASTWSCSPATRTMKNSSRFVL